MRKINKIIIHHTACLDSPFLDIAKIREIHKEKGWYEIGYHFVIEKVKDENVGIIARPLHKIGAHCRGHNEDSIGVAFVGNFDLEKPPPDLILYGIRYVVVPLLHVFSLCVKDIYAHRDLAKTNCPGLLFDMEDFKKKVLEVWKNE